MKQVFTVNNVTDGDQFEIAEGWEWDGVQGFKVVVFGYATPKPGMDGYEFAKQKLTALILNKQVELYNPTFFKNFGTEKLVCNVFLDGVNIANYFPEFKGRTHQQWI